MLDELAARAATRGTRPTSSASPRRSPATSTARSASRARSRRIAPATRDRSAAATSTPSCASCPIRACSTTSTSSPSTTARRRLLALIDHLRDPAQAAAADVRARRRRGRATSTDEPLHDVPLARRRHADLRGPAARSLPVAVRDAQPDAPAVVRRPVEQADDRARLLLEAVHVLRRHARLHRALRPRARGPARRSHRGDGRRDRPDRLSLRRRGRAARRARALAERADRARRR